MEENSIKQTTFLTTYFKRGEKASYCSSSVLFCSFFDIKLENINAQTYYPTSPAEGSFLWFLVLPCPDIIQIACTPQKDSLVMLSLLLIFYNINNPACITS